MRAIAIRKEASPAAAALEGRIACHDVRDEAGRIAISKGQTHAWEIFPTLVYVTHFLATPIDRLIVPE